MAIQTSLDEMKVFSADYYYTGDLTTSETIYQPGNFVSCEVTKDGWVVTLINNSIKIQKLMTPQVFTLSSINNGITVNFYYSLKCSKLNSFCFFYPDSSSDGKEWLLSVDLSGILPSSTINAQIEINEIARHLSFKEENLILFALNKVSPNYI